MRNEEDRATQLSVDTLVRPLAERLGARFPAWSIDAVPPEEATKARLARLLGGADTPAILFSASHGMGFPPADPRQRPHQGAILCRDWPGPLQWRKAIPQDFYFAADDLGEQASLSGLFLFLFCCYGAGTPSSDDFAQQAFRQTATIAPHAFLAHLPQRLLGHPRGGALAVVGHVDRAWTYSFRWPRIGEQLDVFESAMSVVLKGAPLGLGMEFFNDRYAALTAQVEEEKECLEYGKVPDDLMLAGLWTAKNDARNYVIIGDPALRLFPHPDAAMLRQDAAMLR